MDSSAFEQSSVKLKVYSSGESGCQKEFSGFDITIDWFATLGRWSSRYLNSLLSWAAGVASLVVFLGWTQEDNTCEYFSREKVDVTNVFDTQLVCLLSNTPLPH